MMSFFHKKFSIVVPTYGVKYCNEALQEEVDETIQV